MTSFGQCAGDGDDDGGRIKRSTDDDAVDVAPNMIVCPCTKERISPMHPDDHQHWVRCRAAGNR